MLLTKVPLTQVCIYHTCKYLYTFMYIYIYIYTYIYIYILYLNAHLHVYFYTYIVPTTDSIPPSNQISSPKGVIPQPHRYYILNMYMYTYICINRHMYISIHIYIHILNLLHTNIYIYTIYSEPSKPRKESSFNIFTYIYYDDEAYMNTNIHIDIIIFLYVFLYEYIFTYVCI
jgi:hypothetical protein